MTGRCDYNGVRMLRVMVLYENDKSENQKDEVLEGFQKQLEYLRRNGSI